MDYKSRFDLSGKTSIVTGSGSGLGKEMAHALAQFGSNIVVADINEDQAIQTVEELRTYNVETLAVQTDVSQEDQVKRLVDLAIDKFSKIDVLINNAGINLGMKVEDMTLDQWQKIMSVNVNGLFLVSKYVGMKMMASGGGSIINIASASSFIVNKEPQCAYNTSKGAVLMLTKSLASEWVGHNIRVNAIAPGYTITDMVKPTIDRGGKELEAIYQQIPMARFCEPSEICGLALLLASEASSYTTGSVFSADGGITVW